MGLLADILDRPSPVKDYLKVKPHPSAFDAAFNAERVRLEASGEQREVLDRIQELESGKLYHEMTLAMVKYVQYPVSNPLCLASLFSVVMVGRARDLNPHTYVKIACSICELLPPLDAVHFMHHIVDTEGKSSEVLITRQTRLCLDLLRMGDVEAAEEAVKSARHAFDETFGIDVLVSAQWHNTMSCLLMAMGEHEEAYHHRLLHLSYVSTESIPEADRTEMASDLLTIALICKNLFTFGEVMALPLVASARELSGYPGHEAFMALSDLCAAFVNADMGEFRRVVSERSALLDGNSLLKEHSTTVEWKVRMLALMDLAFRQPAGVLTFEDISSNCLLDVNQVEMLVMSAIKNGLFHAKINQVSQKVKISEVRPQVLGLKSRGLEVLAERTRTWIELSRGLSEHMDQIAQEGLANGV